MKQIIDIENWERKENFNFFRHFQNPQLSITSEVECGGAKQRAKAAGQSFSIIFMQCCVQPMKYRSFVTASIRTGV